MRTERVKSMEMKVSTCKQDFNATVFLALGIEDKTHELLAADWLPYRARMPTAGWRIISCSHRTVQKVTPQNQSLQKKKTKELK